MSVLKTHCCKASRILSNMIEATRQSIPATSGNFGWALGVMREGRRVRYVRWRKGRSLRIEGDDLLFAHGGVGEDTVDPCLTQEELLGQWELAK